MECVEGVKEFLLGAFASGQKVNVVENQGVTPGRNLYCRSVYFRGAGQHHATLLINAGTLGCRPASALFLHAPAGSPRYTAFLSKTSARRSGVGAMRSYK